MKSGAHEAQRVMDELGFIVVQAWHPCQTGIL